MPKHSRPLGLAEAADVAQNWLTDNGLVPQSRGEPVAGVVEFMGDGFLARVRVDVSALNQGTVLALLRAVPGSEDTALSLWSTKGFTNGAISVADSQGVALFDVAGPDEIDAVNSHARALMPAADAATFETAVPARDEVSEEDEAQIEWKTCSRCRATHHPQANFCASCGAGLATQTTRERTAETSKFDDRGATQSHGQAVPAPRDDAPTLRCRTCGSNDIELVHR